MKTADLIPFILLELNETDKYGFELTKNIETKSKEKIIIKQPTLYTLLKKLEKSKFISSYWQDSEIGGKRHYYKLTNNGKMQVETLPSYDFLITKALTDENDVDETIKDTIEQPKNSFMDDILAKPTPSESILPTEEVFAETNIDVSTQLEINTSNTDIMRNDNAVLEEQFATNANVSAFTEKTIINLPEIKNSTKSNELQDNDILNVDFTIPKTETEIKFVNYVDLKNNEQYKTGKKISKKLLLQSLATSASLAIMLILCTIITIFTKRSGLYYFFYIGAIITALFYPICIAVNFDKIRLKYQSSEYKTKTKLRLYIGLTAILLVLIVCIIINITISNNTITLMLSFKNFENFYAPILIMSVYFLDIYYNYLFLSKLK